MLIQITKIQSINQSVFFFMESHLFFFFFYTELKTRNFPKQVPKFKATERPGQ